MKKFGEYGGDKDKSPSIKTPKSFTENIWESVKTKKVEPVQLTVYEEVQEHVEPEIQPEPLVEEVVTPQIQVITETIVGPKGDQGERGEKGETGEKGDKGDQGEPGRDGTNGVRGIDGKDGRNGNDGLNGKDGVDGKDGQNGQDGRDGKDGVDGKDGRDGIDGKDGRDGVDGKDGQNGQDGKDGRDGIDGQKGDRGEKGDRGDVGPKGDKGDRGDVGPKGDQGERGEKGDAGETPDIKPFYDKFNKLSLDINKKVGRIVGDMGALAGGGGSGSYWLNDLGDTDYSSIVNATDGQVLTFNSTTGKWVAEDITVTGAVGTLQQVTTAGNTTTLGITTAAVQLNLTSAVTVSQGQMAWNAQDLTVDIGMANGVVLQVGQEQYIKVKASESITDGDAVMFAGVDGEHILAARNDMSSTGYRPEYFIGIATHSFTRNSFGYVTIFGKVHDFNSLPFTNGDILYADPHVVGGLTNVEPQAPHINIMVAAVTKRAGGDGHIMVRPSWRPSLSQLNDVAIISVADNHMLKYVAANSRWENVTYASVIEPAFSKANSATLLAQAAFNYANTIVSDTQIDPFARTQANSAFNKANSVGVTAQAAFDYANTIISDTQIDPWSRNQSNAAFTSANTISLKTDSAYAWANTINIKTDAAFTQANSATTLAQAAYNYANTIVSDTQVDPVARGQANGSFNFANTVNVKVDSVYAFSNTVNIKTDAAFTSANIISLKTDSAYAWANTINIKTDEAFTQANSATTTGQSAFNKANSATVLAQASYDTSNTAYSTAMNAYSSAGTALIDSNTALSQSNVASDRANNAYSTAMNAYSSSGIAIIEAEAAWSHANGAFDKANTAITTSGGTSQGTIVSNNAIAFSAGFAANSGVALQMPFEGALRNSYNGVNTMYFDVSNGGASHGYFNFRSSNAFTSLLHLGSTQATFGSGMAISGQTPFVGRTSYNVALDTVVTVDNIKYRVSNQGGIFPQIASAIGSSVDVCYDVEGIVNGTTNPTYANNSGYLLAANGTWLSIYSTHGMDARGDRLTAHITDKAAGRIYRVTFMRTNNSSNVDGYNIIVERIL